MGVIIELVIYDSFLAHQVKTSGLDMNPSGISAAEGGGIWANGAAGLNNVHIF